MRTVASPHATPLRLALVLLFTLAVLVPLLACSSDIGAECDDEGDVSECVDGAVCGAKTSGGGLVCLKRCVAPNDCGAGEECVSLSKTTLKGCRLR